jgi:cobalt-zinc-cadmium efflux system outer membrane protein
MTSAVLLSFLFASAAAFSQSAPAGKSEESTLPAPGLEAPSVEELVVLALFRSPSVASLQAKLASAREAIAPAGALPDPTFEVTYQDVNFPRYTVGTAEMSMFSAGVRVPLLYPGKRQARRDAAGAEAEVRSTDIEVLKRRLAMEVRTRYARLYALHSENESLRAGRELLDLLAATVSTRYSAGKATQEAVIKARLASLRIDERAHDLAAEIKTVEAALNRLLDFPGDRPLGVVKLLPQVPDLEGPFEEQALENAPDMARMRSEVKAAEYRLQVARSELHPNLSLGTTVGYRGDLDPVVTFQLGIEFPFWKKKKQWPLVRAAQLNVESMRQALRDTRAGVSAEAARLQAQWIRDTEQIRLFREGIVPQTSTAVDAARSSYLAGEGDFSTVIEDFNLWLEARVGLAKREADRFTTWAALDALVAPPSEGERREGERK